jgi:DNA invertase Pin-like site-specific DNA recombinase
MIYCYARVSTSEQVLDRQFVEFEKAGFGEGTVIADKQSGKNFDRKGYQRLKNKVKKGDLIVVQSLDRFGRNYQEIQDEWRFLTHKKGVDIKVLDMPLLDTRNSDTGIAGKLITDIVLQVLAFVAETERTKNKERQSQGIAVAKAKGIKFGRPRSVIVPSNFGDIVARFRNKEITSLQSSVLAGMSRASFFRKMKGNKYE